MESVVKVESSRREIDEVMKKGLLNVRFCAFDVKENGFDPRIMTPEQREEGIDDAWTYVIRVCHADFGPLNKRYPSMVSLLKDVSNRGSAYADVIRKGRGREAL